MHAELFWCVHTPPNSDTDNRICSVRVYAKFLCMVLSYMRIQLQIYPSFRQPFAGDLRRNKSMMGNVLQQAQRKTNFPKTSWWRLCKNTSIKFLSGKWKKQWDLLQVQYHVTNVFKDITVTPMSQHVRESPLEMSEIVRKHLATMPYETKVSEDLTMMTIFMWQHVCKTFWNAEITSKPLAGSAV